MSQNKNGLVSRPAEGVNKGLTREEGSEDRQDGWEMTFLCGCSMGFLRTQMEIDTHKKRETKSR